VGLNDPRRGTVMSMGTIPGMTRIGSSSTQSLVRGAGSIETDYLNGEIALLARQTGVAAPMNEWFARHAFTWARTGIAHGSISRDEVKATLGL
ncbi:MAG: ketopantoate reductase family protein, partial [Rhodobiaceae bacterium]|nr:ketopantoate reductase family protein [Rhodobiaceae bacterium]